MIRDYLQPNGGVDVRAIRRDVSRKLGMMQTMACSDFALLSGVSARALEEWESGRRKPTPSAVTLLLVVAMHPRAVQEVVEARYGRAG